MSKQTSNSSIEWRIVAPGVGIAVVLIGGVVIYALKTPSVPPQAPETASSTAFSYIEPTYAPGEQPHESLTIGQRKALEQELSDTVTQEKAAGTITQAGVWFRDLNNGPVIGIHEDIKFSPASLLKLPLAIWFYRQASTSPDVLTQEIEFTGPKGQSIEHFPGLRGMEIGTTYSIDDLIQLMLEESDNDATAVLSGIAGIKNTDNVYKDLGIESVDNYQTYVIDVKTYGAFFRVLYTTSYVNKEYSDRILKYLDQSTFSAGLEAGVPDSIHISHKFGERVIDPTTGIYQLHDCGIVYYPNKPYELCVMTQGHNYDQLAGVIAKLSREAYTAIKEGD